MSKKLVITGIGATTPIGGDVPTLWQNALAGTSGANTLEYDWVEQYDLPVTFAAEVSVDPKAVLSKPEAKRMDRSTQLGMVASREAWSDAYSLRGLRGERHRPAAVRRLIRHRHRRSVDAPGRMGHPAREGPSTCAADDGADADAQWGRGAISLAFGARAGARTSVSACASGVESLVLAIDMLRRGEADIVLAGGTEGSIHPLPLAAFGNMQALSRRNDDPAAASRPYDVDRDGFVMGEGAGALVVETEEHAGARRAHLCRAGGRRCHFRCPPHHGSRPRGAGRDAGHSCCARIRGSFA
ncbi:hypothetical protein [Nesterenkonia pannonica]|uniref:beta-ketoacyl-[acyl-carrier-protein] synthase family protein n=1 Tax=Nesterenkonia pannonica TaxID=1548602 RepID=UPI002164287B|nr:beta-ketoacyl synthase N-terminal-like domain-containing protein [Nesterenkonia pannonica]